MNPEVTSPATRTLDRPLHPEEPRTLIDALLAEQHQLTAVETFALQHDVHAPHGSHYRDLIPQVAPGPGYQLAFEVNLDQCSGCKACVTACHSLNGLDDGEAWREVGTLLSEDWRQPFRQTVTTACHHCADPACLNGCPVLAYEKDAVTGIVRHLDDQCIGCQYCIFKCPYDVPKYSPARGIVRKCDMCFQRLEVGEAPACAQACPNEAIRITLVYTAELAQMYRAPTAGNAGVTDASLSLAVEAQSSSTYFLPASPDPAITLPTTRYVASRPLPAHLVPASDRTASLQPPHWPLVWMLVLTQMGVGMLAFAPFVPRSAQPVLVWASLCATLIGLVASSLHLGQPTKAWRSFLNLRRSWLSREIVVFGLFLPTLAVTAFFISRPWSGSKTAAGWIGAAALLLGMLGVFCSGMVYHDTARPFWRGVRSIVRFAATSAILGLAAAWCVDAMWHGHSSWLPAALLLVSLVKFAGDHRFYRRDEAAETRQATRSPRTAADESLARSARLMRGRLGAVTRIRFAATLLGGLVLPATALILPQMSWLVPTVALTLCFGGELAERYLFFRAVVPPQMPRGN